MSFIWNTKNTDRNGANEQNLRKGLLMLVTDIPAFFRNNLPYLPLPLFLREGSEPALFGEISKTQTPLYKGKDSNYDYKIY